MSVFDTQKVKRPKSASVAIDAVHVVYIILRAGITYWPPMHVMFGIAPIGWQEWGDRSIEAKANLFFAIGD